MLGGVGNRRSSTFRKRRRSFALGEQLQDFQPMAVGRALATSANGRRGSASDQRLTSCVCSLYIQQIT